MCKCTLNGKNVAHMTRGSDDLHFFFDEQNRPAVVVFNGTAYAYVKNLQGDIVAILDSSKNVVVNYVYDAWGRPISCSGTMANTLGKINPFRYRGYVYDQETMLYYLNSRYYNSLVSRFISTDIQLYGSDNLTCHNLFTYCGNAPVFQYDPNGREAITAGSILSTSGFGAAAAAALAEPTFVGELLLGLYFLGLIAVASTYDPDPYARPNQKKQGRENKNKSRKDKNWEPRNNKRDGKPNRPPKHTPGRDHRKYIIPVAVPFEEEYYLEPHAIN